MTLLKSSKVKQELLVWDWRCCFQFWLNFSHLGYFPLTIFSLIILENKIDWEFPSLSKQWCVVNSFVNSQWRFSMCSLFPFEQKSDSWGEHKLIKWDWIFSCPCALEYWLGWVFSAGLKTHIDIIHGKLHMAKLLLLVLSKGYI